MLSNKGKNQQCNKQENILHMHMELKLTQLLLHLTNVQSNFFSFRDVISSYIWHLMNVLTLNKINLIPPLCILSLFYSKYVIKLGHKTVKHLKLFSFNTKWLYQFFTRFFFWLRLKLGMTWLSYRSQVITTFQSMNHNL